MSVFYYFVLLILFSLILRNDESTNSMQNLILDDRLAGNAYNTVSEDRSEKPQILYPLSLFRIYSMNSENFPFP